MSTSESSHVAFTGSVPRSYQDLLVPIKFEPYATDLAARVEGHLHAGGAVLEAAAGTGVVTRELERRLGAGTRLVATDLNPDMIAVAREQSTRPETEHVQADATALPFEDGAFNAVACQFGVMFYPDEARGHAEARRVLKQGGWYCFNVWDDFNSNPMMQCLQSSLDALSPSDPPRFFSVPFRPLDATGIVRTLQRAGFGEVRMTVLTKTCRVPSSCVISTGVLQSTPLGHELAERGLEGAPEAMERGLAETFADGDADRAFEVPMQAVVFEAEANAE